MLRLIKTNFHLEHNWSVFFFGDWEVSFSFIVTIIANISGNFYNVFFGMQQLPNFKAVTI